MLNNWLLVIQGNVTTRGYYVAILINQISVLVSVIVDNRLLDTGLVVMGVFGTAIMPIPFRRCPSSNKSSFLISRLPIGAP
jgi:hypothetical protein